MKFSFVIPALNEEDYIKTAIESIKGQTEAAYEIIVVDNGSTDKTAEIARISGAKVVKEVKCGISHARNKGAKVARGDILCFVDADGVLSKDWARRAKSVLLNKGVLAVDGLIIFSHKDVLKRVLYNTWTIIVYTGLILSKLLLARHFFTGNNMAIRRKVFEKLGGFDPVVSEQVRLSRKFWRFPGGKAIFSPKMVIYQSSRRFEAKGYIRTIFFWIKAALTDVPQEGYGYKSAIP